MHILIVSALFPPEPLVSASTSANLAAALLQRGHQVTVLAPYPSRPSGRHFPGYPSRLYYQENQDGIKIIRCRSTISPKSSLLGRLLENLTFGFTSACRVLIVRPLPQVIYANTWPLVAQGLLVVVVRLLRIPLVLSIQDLYPESLVLQGRLVENSIWNKWLLVLDGWIARSAQAVVAISDEFAHTYRKVRRVPPEQLYVVPNWVEQDLWEQQDGSGVSALRSGLGVCTGARLFVFAGNIGEAAGVEHLLHVFKDLPDCQDIHLLVAGEGSRMAGCQQLAIELNMKQVHFLSPWPTEQTVDVLRASDILLLPTRGDQSLASLPSKLLNYLFAGRPVIATVAPESAAARLIQESGAGWCISPGDESGLRKVILQAANAPKAELKEMGDLGSIYAAKHINQHVSLAILTEIIEQVA